VEDHSTYLFPRLEEAQNFVTQQQQAMLTNPFQHRKNLTQASTSTEGGSQEACPTPNNPSSANVYMVRGDAFITTRVHDYSKPSAYEKGKEADLPSLPLQIEKTLGETMTRIPKGAFKKLLTTQTQGLPITTLWWRIYHKPLVQCMLWRSSKSALLRGKPC
jgi:hypothetical protein